ncbi:tobamovirus multiplication protein 2A-like [Cajanus cajan]|uniref:tobamovirus multiplication protein 2A-like n=1 Tax=Cajanus cajan TaxID=3821 RepID=UPI00098D9044|nr:tobamovirus multiplication protein 2A-like [Cajanus cajan]
MAKSPCVEFILLVINLVFTLTSVGTIGFGLICFLRFKQSSSMEILDQSNTKSFIAHRMLLAIHHPSQQFYDQLLPKTWFVFLLIAIGAILFIISCCGIIGTTLRSRCCLLSYCIFLVALVAVELATAAFIFFNKHDWKEIMPEDRSGNFHRVYQFLNVNWKIIKWVALGVLITQVIGIVLAVYLRRVLNRPKWHAKRDDDKNVQYLPRVRTRIPNYRILSQENSNPSATNSANGGGPTRPT